MKRLLFFIAFMTLGTFALVQLLVREPSAPQAEAPPPPQASNVLDMDSVDVHQLLGERLRWELQARHATYNEITNSGVLDTVRFQVYDVPVQDGPPATIAGSSRQAFLMTRPGSLVLQGDVVVTRGERLEIRSQRMEYDAARQILTSPGPVRVRSDRGIQEGSAMRYFLAEERMEFTRPVFYQ